MKITYIARHGGHGNDDEGAIAHSLQLIGHEVVKMNEVSSKAKYADITGDLVLFHHWPKCKELLQDVKVPKAFWCFDLIDFPDETLEVRCAQRKAWIRGATEIADIGFCTDGDWVEKDKSGKLHWLMQGADTRVLGRGSAGKVQCDLLFTGNPRGGVRRMAWYDEMTHVYGPRFHTCVKGSHGRALADLIDGARIIVAPDGPTTNCYWSNRVYITLGFGGFMLHPYCARLFKQYDNAKDLVFYRSRAELHDLVRYYLDRPNDSVKIATSGLERTRNEHTYTHRCAELITIVKERLGI